VTEGETVKARQYPGMEAGMEAGMEMNPMVESKMMLRLEAECIP
jgi:hypothetical protein